MVPEHEDKADSSWNPDRLDSDHRTVCLWWLQMLMNCSSAIYSIASHGLVLLQSQVILMLLLVRDFLIAGVFML